MGPGSPILQPDQISPTACHQAHLRAPKVYTSAHERIWISTCLMSLLQEGKLINDPQREAQWVGISLIKRMVKAMTEEAFVSGTRSWDCTISKSLSIFLLSSLGSRGGDITLSKGYKNAKYLR